MDLNRLHAFVRVVAEGSFTGAAKSLGVPKSSVSRSVALLEQALGTRLLQRSTRRLHLTEAGAAYYERVANALASIDEASALATEMQATPRGTVRVAAPVDLGVGTLVPLIAKFVRRHPLIHVDLSLAARVVDLVAEGFDLAVRAGPLRDTSLIARKVGTVDNGLFASPGYARRRGLPKRVDDLAEHDCVLFRPAHAKATWALRGPHGTTEVDVTGSLHLDDMGAVRKAALVGVGIGLLPAFLGVRDVELGRLVRVLPDHAGPGAPLHIVYPSARLVPQRVALLRDHLLEGLGRVPWSCEDMAAHAATAPKKTTTRAR
jgi:DNA-binding transcriptional LysR family regulator